MATIGAIRKIAEAKRIAMHLDGARLFNAVVATGIAAAEYARSFETVSFCLSKGLGAPVGSVICSDRGRIGKLRRLRKMFGGVMRQAGILAAAGLYALEHNIDRLTIDHRHAKHLGAALVGLPGVRIRPEHIETNIVVFDISETGRTAEEVLSSLKHEGLLLVPFGPTTLRAVTHLDVTGEQIEQACAILKKVCTTQGMLAIVKCGQSPFSELFGQALDSEAVRRMLAAFNRNAPFSSYFLLLF